MDFGDFDDQSQYRTSMCPRSFECPLFALGLMLTVEKRKYESGYVADTYITILVKKPFLEAAGCSSVLLLKMSHFTMPSNYVRNWDEFYYLNILTCYQYLPSPKWASWVEDKLKQQFLQLGLIPYMQMDIADKLSSRETNRARGMNVRRTYQVLEARNFICACMKRNSPVSRRFIQYIALQSNNMVLLVRDVMTGNLVVRPPDEETWLLRDKVGYGRAAKNDWSTIKEVGPVLFEEMDQHRKWHFGFKEYYDVIIWDLDPGHGFHELYNTVQTTLIKAHRLEKRTDLYKPCEPILRTITRDKKTLRARDMMSDEQDVKSIW